MHNKVCVRELSPDTASSRRDRSNSIRVDPADLEGKQGHRYKLVDMDQHGVERPPQTPAAPHIRRGQDTPGVFQQKAPPLEALHTPVFPYKLIAEDDDHLSQTMIGACKRSSLRDGRCSMTLTRQALDQMGCVEASSVSFFYTCLAYNVTDHLIICLPC